jgi:hypothetical protein
MAKAPVALETQADEVEKAYFAVFAINPHFTLGLWLLDPSKLPEGHEAFMRSGDEVDVQMARTVIKMLDA